MTGDREAGVTTYTRTHWGCLMYLETRIVDHGGQVQRNQPQMNEDDWSAVEDMVRDGLLVWGGTGFNPVFSLTDSGWSTSGALRRWRGEGKRVADFVRQVSHG